MSNDALLSLALSAAVPLRMIEIKARYTAEDWPWLADRARACGDYLAPRGDVLLFGGSSKGEAAEVRRAGAHGVDLYR